MVEPLGNSVQVPYTPCSHCVDEVREGSVQSNHSELTSKTSTHLAFSALKWFEKVRGGSRGLNHSETVYTYPTLYTVSEWFNPLEPPRTFSNHFSAEKERCVKHISVTKFVNNNQQPQTIKLVTFVHITCSY